MLGPQPMVCRLHVGEKQSLRSTEQATNVPPATAAPYLSCVSPSMHDGASLNHEQTCKLAQLLCDALSTKAFAAEVAGDIDISSFCCQHHPCKSGSVSSDNCFQPRKVSLQSPCLKLEPLPSVCWERGGWEKRRRETVCPFKTSPVCRLKTLPCMPAPRAHVQTHVRVVPVHTETFSTNNTGCVLEWTHGLPPPLPLPLPPTPPPTHTDTHNHIHAQHNHKQQHTTTRTAQHSTTQNTPHRSKEKREEGDERDKRGHNTPHTQHFRQNREKLIAFTLITCNYT